MIVCPKGILIHGIEIAELIAGLTVAMEMTQTMIDSETPRWREFTKVERVKFAGWTTQVLRWRKLRDQLMKEAA